MSADEAYVSTKKKDGEAKFEGTDGKACDMAFANATTAVEKQSRAEFIRTDVQSMLTSKRKVSDSQDPYNRTKNSSYLNTEPQPTHRR